MQKLSASIVCALLLLLCSISSADEHGKQPGATGYALKTIASDAAVSPTLLHDDENVKIVLVQIAAGQTMAEHVTPVPVTVQTLSGEGSMRVSGKEHALAAGTIYHMNAKAPHALVAKKGAPLVVLVHYLKRSASGGEHACAGDCAHHDQRNKQHSAHGEAHHACQGDCGGQHAAHQAVQGHGEQGKNAHECSGSCSSAGAHAHACQHHNASSDGSHGVKNSDAHACVGDCAKESSHKCSQHAAVHEGHSGPDARGQSKGEHACAGDCSEEKDHDCPHKGAAACGHTGHN